MLKNTITYKNAKVTYVYNHLNLNKPTIICLHGFLEHKTIFNFLFEDEAFNAYNLIAVDLLGHAETDAIGYVHTMENQAEMIMHLMQHLQIQKTSLIGHSMGGYVALAFLEMFPQHVTQLFLINSSAKADNDVKKANRARGIALVKKNAAVFIQMAIANLFDEQTKQKQEATINELKQIALANTTQGVIANMQGMLERKDRAFLLHNHDNIYFIAGTNDNIIPIDEVREQLVGTKQPINEINGYHMLWLEQPEAIQKILKAKL
ncbi:alpha/beta hydrolase [Flavobacterium agricola]|uniref:Alpha/beta hydrolase n=1 Tax=Flavobacterium agricola TaxID=2870839 RepID=A0ABY6LXZ9_9FLAO|nr:alpha/beta hydrolase [Flavobacterium agricola]UYW00857.1 alpha/beta hydrolase [Flavobacterium agricola]